MSPLQLIFLRKYFVPTFNNTFIKLTACFFYLLSSHKVPLKFLHFILFPYMSTIIRITIIIYMILIFDILTKQVKYSFILLNNSTSFLFFNV